ncbi:S-layer homology domain-containing protein, partial [Paenibacillus thailandensis]
MNGTKRHKRAYRAFPIVICMLAYVLFGLQPAAIAAGQEAKLPQVRIVTSAAQAQVGDVFEVAVWLQGFTGDYADIQGYEVHLAFDASLVQPVAEIGDPALKPAVFQAAAGPMTLVNSIDAESGTVKVSQITTKKGSLLFAGYGKIGTVTFKAASPGVVRFSQTKSIVIKADNPGVNVIHTINSASVEIVPAGGAAAGGAAETQEQIGEAPSESGSGVTDEQALQAFKDYGDVAALSWAKDAIGAFARSKVLQGSPSGYFEPRRSMTRAEFAKTAVVALGLDMKQQLKPTFADVPKTAWHYDYVETAAQYGLVQGTPLGAAKYFKPNDPITRAEIAAIVARVLRELE